MSNTPFTIKQTKQYDIPGGRCYLYPDAPTQRLSCALVEQDGRYPAAGYRQNEKCTEALFVIKGKFQITLNGQTYKIKAKDVTYIPPRTPYAIEGKGQVFVFIEPKWDSTQNTQVQEHPPQ